MTYIVATQPDTATRAITAMIGAMSQGLTARQQAFVAAYIGEARYNATKAARIAGYSHPNKQGPALLVNLGIREAIDAHLAEVKAQGIAIQEYRLRGMDELEQGFRRIISERGAAMEDEVPGGGTGLLMRQEKQLGTGDRAVITTEYTTDTAISSALLSLYKQAAQELGQWSEKRDINLDGGLRREYVVITEHDDKPITDEELAVLELDE